MVELKNIATAVMEGDPNKVVISVQEAIDKKVSPQIIIDEGLILGMNVVGEKFKVGDMFVPEVLMSARTMQSGMNIVKPLLEGKKMKTKGLALIGTVKGDLHDIGKNLVAMIMESNGYEVIDLGVDISPEMFLKSAMENKADIIAMSALLTTTMLSMKETIELFEKENLRANVKFVIGGAPVTQVFSEEIGSDGYAPDAASAIDVINELLDI